MVGIFFASCSTDHFDDLNTDKKHPSEVPGDPLFSNGLRNGMDHMNDCNVNRNNYRLYAQYWAQCTYPEESQYNMAGRAIPDNVFAGIYRDGLRDLKEARDIFSATETNDETKPIIDNKIAIIDIAMSYFYTYLVDVFGDIPYTDALQLADGINLPKYDDDAAVYAACKTTIQSAMASMNDGPSFEGSVDFIYGGDVAAWKKFGNSLLLRMAMRTPENAGTLNLDNLISSNDEAFAIQYFAEQPNTNPVYVSLVASGRNDYVPSNTLIDFMNGTSDPRRNLWFVTTDTTVFIGGQYGTANSYAAFSHIGDAQRNPTLKGNLFSYSEVEFLLAEAAERGVGGSDAASHYAAAVTASILEWGGSSDMVTAFLEANPYNGLQSIAEQKWVAMYNNGPEGWATYRLFTDQLKGIMNPADGLTVDDIPRRLIYPINEATLNGENLEAAATAMGGDKKSSKIFWD